MRFHGARTHTFDHPLPSARCLPLTLSNVAGPADRCAVARVQPLRIVEAVEPFEVMHFRRRRDAASLGAVAAQRFRSQNLQPQPTPCTVVAARCGAQSVRPGKARRRAGCDRRYAAGRCADTRREGSQCHQTRPQTQTPAGSGSGGRKCNSMTFRVMFRPRVSTPFAHGNAVYRTFRSNSMKPARRFMN
jgi:hypothetical protein